MELLDDAEFDDELINELLVVFAVPVELEVLTAFELLFPAEELELDPPELAEPLAVFDVEEKSQTTESKLELEGLPPLLEVDSLVDPELEELPFAADVEL